MDIISIARICHEANRAIQIVTGDPAPSAPWDQAEYWQQGSAIEGVQKALDGETAEQLHESWCAYKEAEGWVYGLVKDAVAKTHPCLVSYDALPDEQKAKDHVFAAIVAALREPAPVVEVIETIPPVETVPPVVTDPVKDAGEAPKTAE